MYLFYFGCYKKFWFRNRAWNMRCKIPQVCQKLSNVHPSLVKKSKQNAIYLVAPSSKIAVIWALILCNFSFSIFFLASCMHIVQRSPHEKYEDAKVLHGEALAGVCWITRREKWLIWPPKEFVVNIFCPAEKSCCLV